LYREVERGPEANGENNKEERYESLAITLSNSANVVLLIIKIIASVKSRSLAIAASTLESLLDLIAGVILLFTRWAMHRENVYKYPIGKLRMQPVGIVVFAAIMATLGFQVFITAVEQLMEGNTAHKMNSGELVWLSVVMGIATAAKLALFLFCRTFESPIVQAYSQDHCFDALTNLVGLGAALLANRYYWWIDPVGALLLAVFTIFEWSRTVLENAESLVGQAAPSEFIRKITFITLSHDDRIQHIDTVRAYRFGEKYFVEVDIELPEDMHLRKAHDIGESLQYRLELLPEVERAYVHLDYETTHHPEHTVQHHETLA
jgi:cation diffusion facilitator family transporter